jgi:hypothetical protein
MATSPNYAWAEPDNSSLVKNGAADIRTLGDAIDTSVWNIGFGQAGKNKIINGDFGIWQRGTSFTPSVGSGWNYNSDRFRWLGNGTGGARTISRQSFTAGTAPVAGYESTYFLRFDSTSATTGATDNLLSQPIEDVRTFAGNTVTLSFWAKAASAITLPTISIIQDFGGGGSAGVVTTAVSSQAITTSWVRYSYSVAIPSITGKTIGTSPSLEVRLSLPINSTFTFDTWGWQLEYGSKATPFETASGGSPQAELAMCQRYYQRWSSTQFNRAGFVYADSTTNAVFVDKLPVCLRGTPTLTFTNMTANGNAITAAAVVYILDTANSVYCNLTTSGVSANTVYQLYVAASQTGVIAYSSEL